VIAVPENQELNHEEHEEHEDEPREKRFWTDARLMYASK